MTSKNLERLPALGLQVRVGFAFAHVVITTHASGTTDVEHFFWAPRQAPNPSSLSNDLIYHGDNAGPGATGALGTDPLDVCRTRTSR